MKIQITDLKKAVTSLDRLLESLQQVRRQLENAIHPPEILVCTACLCSWAGTTHDAIWNDGDQEYRCPECGSSEVSMFDTETAGDLVDYLAEKQAEKLRSVINTVRGVTLFQPHTTPQIEESLAAAFADAEADFLAQYEVTTCPYCGEETALITPGGRVVCSCWTNPAQEVVEDLQQADAPQWEFFHEENLPGEWPEELGVRLRRGMADVEVRVTPYPGCLTIECFDPEGAPYEMEVSLTVVEPDGVKLDIKNHDARCSVGDPIADVRASSIYMVCRKVEGEELLAAIVAGDRIGAFLEGADTVHYACKHLDYGELSAEQEAVMAARGKKHG